MNQAAVLDLILAEAKLKPMGPLRVWLVEWNGGLLLTTRNREVCPMAFRLGPYSMILRACHQNCPHHCRGSP